MGEMQAMNNLAATLRILGDLDSARTLHEKALAGRRRVLGDGDLNTVASMNDLVEVRRELGKWQP